MAVQSALTGHFVVSSLHATDSVSALHRFLDMGIESFLIASSVLAVVGQRLLRRICPSCRTSYTPTDEEMIFYEEAGGPPKTSFFQGTGCNYCANTGYKDRIGIYELLVMTPEIRRLMVGWATQEELRNMAVKQGMRTLRQEAISLVAQDITSIAEVIQEHVHAMSLDKSTRHEVTSSRHSMRRDNRSPASRLLLSTGAAHVALLARGLQPLEVGAKTNLLALRLRRRGSRVRT